MTTSDLSTPPSRLRRVSPFRRFLNRPEFGAVAGTLLVLLIFVILTGGKGFLEPLGIAGTLQIAAQFGILGATVSLLMIAGEFDLSIGSMIGAAGLVLALCVVTFGLPVWLGVLITFAFAMSWGALNGFVVVRTGLPSFLVTLASLFILRGASIGFTRMITNLTVITGVKDATKDDPFTRLFTTTLVQFGGGPGEVRAEFKIEIIWWILVAGLATWVLMRTRFGNWIFGAGGSAAAARNLGVPVRRVKITLFMCTAASAALLACIQVLSTGSADVLRGQNKEFEAIITAVIGGTALTGGFGSALGSVFGALTLAITQLGIFFVPGFNTDWYQVVLGVLLLAAVLFNDYIRRRASEGRK
jgi:simple sugar transport system permease protein